MLSLKPIPENQANKETTVIFYSIKQTLGTVSVPLIFCYLANFPSYLDFIWQQAVKNLSDLYFKRHFQEIENFAQTAINQIYTPSPATKLFLEKIEEKPETYELSQFATKTSNTCASLYLLSLSIRESLKGAYLGIKQIGEGLEEKERVIFSNLKEGFSQDTEKMSDLNYSLQESSSQIIKRQEPAIVISVFAEFFKFMEWEMERLVKREDYLTRRVELERFALSKLPLLPYPFESSFPTVAKKTAQSPDFPELLYLIAELFPTQTPYKLLASAVMKKALGYKTSSSEKDPLDELFFSGVI